MSIAESKTEARTYLTEDKAKSLVQRYGVPVQSFRVVESAEAAQAYVTELNRPVAMKVIADGVVHKSQHGCVRLGVTAGDAALFFDELVAAAHRVPGSIFHGVLIEPMVAKGHEVIVGGVWDPSYGPVVMFGSGGTSVEAIDDLTFRLAPVEREEACRLVHGARMYARSNKLAAPERFDQLVDVLLAIAGPNGVLISEPVLELDINPLIVNEDGVIAVDARVLVSENRKAIGRPRNQKTISDQLRAAFVPSSMVVIGASSNPDKLGYAAIKRSIDFGFRGELYGVNPKDAGPILGCPVVPSVAALPHAFERADVFVPAERVPDVLRECARNGVKVAQVYAAGFSEWSDSADDIEQSIRDIVAKHSLRVIGPNCFGTYCPEGRLTLIDARFSAHESGRAMVISQSGAYACDFVRRGFEYGLTYSKVVSSGNCIDVDMTDYLLYADSDPATEIIAMYLEQSRDLGELFRAAARITKPLIILRGGRTRSGSRVSASHTGSMATDTRIFDDAARQTGVVVVDDLEDVINLLMAYQAFGAIAGRGLGIFGSGGGVAVVSADTAERWRMKVPTFAAETLARLSESHQPGTIVSNPVDLPVWNLRRGGRYIHADVVKTIAVDSSISSIITYVEVGAAFDGRTDEAGRAILEEQVRELLSHAPFPTPMSLVFRSGYSAVQEQTIRHLRRECMAKGVPVFATMTEAIVTHSRLADIHEMNVHKIPNKASGATAGLGGPTSGQHERV